MADICNGLRQHNFVIDFKRNWSSGAELQLQNQFCAGFLLICSLSFKLKAFLFNASLMKFAFVQGYGNVLLCKNFKVTCF